MRLIPTAVIPCLACSALLWLGGCEMERRIVKQSAWHKLFTESEWAMNNGETSATGTQARRYAVELGRFETSTEIGQATQLVRQARTDGGLAEVWYSSDAEWTRVYAGNFSDPDSPTAEALLREARRATIGGQRAFADAEIVAIGAGRAETLDPFDLRTLSGRGLFTLQVGYFDRDTEGSFRRAAERTVRQMRANDEEAYYYHGPYRSLILINTWTRDQAFTSVTGQMDRYSNEVRAVQRKYPHNVPNGRLFTAADDADFVRTQASFIVPIR